LWSFALCGEIAGPDVCDLIVSKPISSLWANRQFSLYNIGLRLPVEDPPSLCTSKQD